MEDVLEYEIKIVLQSFQKNEISGPDGWNIEFYLSLYELIGKYLQGLVEDSHREGRMNAPLNLNFISLISNKYNPQCMDEFIHFSLCNCIYKIVAKVIERLIKMVLSESISQEKLHFLEVRQIHEAVEVAQEGIHSIKTKNIKGAVLKIDLSKAFDIVSWIYLRILLTHLGFEVNFIRWVMSCITTSYFVVLINRYASPFFKAKDAHFPLYCSYWWQKV
jgi:hypothetical protein